MTGVSVLAPVAAGLLTGAVLVRRLHARRLALFVSCGIGFSALPVRINAPPQVVFVELAPGDARG